MRHPVIFPNDILPTGPRIVNVYGPGPYGIARCGYSRAHKDRAEADRWAKAAPRERPVIYRIRVIPKPLEVRP